MNCAYALISFEQNNLRLKAFLVSHEVETIDQCLRLPLVQQLNGITRTSPVKSIAFDCQEVCWSVVQSVRLGLAELDVPSV